MGTGSAGAISDASSDPSAERIARPFDQTNGLADTMGESDEMAGSEAKSAADREKEDGDDGTVPPIVPPAPTRY
jgi:hypothetical protein